MMSWTSLAFAACLFAATPANDHRVTFDGATYDRQFTSGTAQGRLAEYVEPGETVKNWTKLVAVRTFPHLDDPAAAAAGVVRMLQKTNPLARFQLLTKEDKTEAMIDFITWPEDASYSEFNVFRYIKQPDQRGLVCYQFAYRFRDISPERTEQIKKDRQRWIDAMIKADFPLDFDE